MKYKIELKTKIVNDIKNRMPPLGKIKDAVDLYSKDGKGLVVCHDSIYDYQYNTNGNNYSQIDTLTVIGHILESIIIDDKLFIIVDINDNVNITNDYICFFRSKMKNTTENDNIDFDMFNIFAVDLIVINNDNINRENLSIVEKLN